MCKCTYIIKYVRYMAKSLTSQIAHSYHKELIATINIVL